MPPSTAQRASLAEFIGITRAPEKAAAKTMKANGWNVAAAVQRALDERRPRRRTQLDRSRIQLDRYGRDAFLQHPNSILTPKHLYEVDECTVLDNFELSNYGTSKPMEITHPFPIGFVLGTGDLGLPDWCSLWVLKNDGTGSSLSDFRYVIQNTTGVKDCTAKNVAFRPKDTGIYKPPLEFRLPMPKVHIRPTSLHLSNGSCDNCELYQQEYVCETCEYRYESAIDYADWRYSNHSNTRDAQTESRWELWDNHDILLESVVTNAPSISTVAVPGQRTPVYKPLAKTVSDALSHTIEAANTHVNSYYGGEGAPSVKDKDTLGKLFEKYRDPKTDEPDTVSVEGTMRYLSELGLNMENAEILIPMEIVQAPAMGEMTRSGFVEGWKVIGADTIAKQKSYLAGQIKSLTTDMDLFKRVYRHTFICSKEKGQKSLDKDTALVYWELLFSEPGPSWVTTRANWIEMWTEYLKAKWSKSINKDMWNQTFEFFLKSMQDETLSFWNEDGAWPGVIDDFVAYAKEKRGDLPETMETD